MKPSASHLIEAARLALQEHVAPDVRNELAASAVRSITMILKHLAVRSDQEGEILWAENRALKHVLLRCADTLSAMDQPPNPQLADRIEDELSTSRVAALEYPSIALLDEENAALRLLLDDLLNSILSALRDHPEREVLQLMRGQIRAHLDAQILRERVLYFPVFTGPPV